MTMIVVGVDPGKNGAIAIYDGARLQTYALHDYHIKSKKKRVKSSIDWWALVKDLDYHLRNVNIDRAYFEHVNAMPGQGVTSMFNFGLVTGTLRGIFLAHEVTIVDVASQTWKAYHRLIGQSKGESRARAAAVFPEYADWFSRAKDDGPAEAALIACYGFADVLGIAGTDGARS